MRGRRYMLPAIMLSAGLFLLNGCLPVPLPGSFDTPYGMRPDKAVGRAELLPLQTSTRDDVLRLLGEPNAIAADGDLVYVFPVEAGKTWWMMCGTEKSFVDRYLLVDIDGDQLVGKTTFKSERLLREQSDVGAIEPAKKTMQWQHLGGWGPLHVSQEPTSSPVFQSVAPRYYRAWLEYLQRAVDRGEAPSIDLREPVPDHPPPTEE